MKYTSQLNFFMDSYRLESKFCLHFYVIIRNEKHEIIFRGTEIESGAPFSDKVKEMLCSKLNEIFGYAPFEKNEVNDCFNKNRSIILEDVW